MTTFLSLKRALLLSSVVIVLAGCVSVDGQMLDSTAPGQISAAAQAGGVEEWMLPSTAPGYLMRTKVYRPAGDGPFPMAVISHGSEQDPAGRRRMRQPEYKALTSWFLDRGYVVVVPERPGHGGGGRYLEDQGGCDDANFLASANGAADSIAAVVDYMRRQEFVKPGDVILAGHSAGAFGSLAYAARGAAGVDGVVNFSGGRGGHHMNRPANNCAPTKLVEAAGRFGSTTRVPTLWIYAQNDTYFPPALSHAMADAFTGAGGKADYLLLPAQSGPGHAVIASSGAWSGQLQAFLATLP